MNRAMKGCLSLLLLGWFFLTHAAEIGLDQSNGVDLLIFSGEIRQGDGNLLKPYIEKLQGREKPRRFIIHSQGGNVTEAMKIGDLLRQNNFSVFEPQGVSCISACIFAIMGGVDRVINGRIGLHHPLFLNVPNTNPHAQKLLLEGKEVMMRYAVRMSVDPQIVQEMYSLPSVADIQYLTKAQLKHYRLSTEP